MTMTTQNFGQQLRKVIDEGPCTDPASVSDPSRPEYDKKSPYYDPTLDRTSEQFGQGLTFSPGPAHGGAAAGAGRPSGPSRSLPSSRAEKR